MERDMRLHFKFALETAFERIETARSEEALAAAIVRRDSIIDDCQIYCRNTGHRMEDIFDLPR